MSDTLICLECGQELNLAGRTAGQRFQCQSCGASVEVPALRRTIKRGRRLATPRDRPLRSGRETSGRVWASLGAGLLAVILVVVATWWTLTARARRAQLDAVEGLAAQAKASARERNYGAALAEVQDALDEASRLEPNDEALLARLRALRDQITVNDVKAQFPKIDVLPPEQKVAAYQALRSRIRENPELARYEEVASARLNQAFEEWGEADVKQAASLFAARSAARAMDLCERAVGNTSTLATERSHAIRAEADALASQIIPRRGLKLEKIRGQYTLGSDLSYASVLQRDLAEVLRQRGYVVRRDSSYWDALWNQHLPFRVTVEVKEQYAGLYPQTKARMFYTGATVVLEQEQNGQKKKVWDAMLTTRTPQKVRNLKGFRNEIHNPELEKTFYDDARALFGKGIMPKLLTIPEYQSLPGVATRVFGRSAPELSQRILGRSAAR